MRQARFPNGERFALLYSPSTYLPDPEATRHSVVYRRTRNGSVSTMEHELRAIGLGLDWAKKRGVDIEQRIGSVELLSAGEILDLHDCLRLNTQPRRASDRFVAPVSHYNRCVYFRDYLVKRALVVVGRAGNERQIAVNLKLDAFRKRVDSLLRKPKPGNREGLAPEVECRLREVIRPGHPENPFRRKHQHRNFALLLLYLELPLRLSEALSIKGMDLALDGSAPLLTVHRRADDPDDRRGRQPLVKTNARVLPLGEDVRAALLDWVLRARVDKARYPGAKRTPFVFVSERGLPMGMSTVADVFRLLRTRISGLPPNLSAHVLRHTWNDRFSELADADGMPEAVENLQRSNLNGWSHGSKTAETYTRRHTRMAAQKASLAMQRRNYGDKRK